MLLLLELELELARLQRFSVCYPSANPSTHLPDPRGVPSLTLKSMPTVEMKLPARKAPSLKRTSRQVLPTPESPTSITCREGWRDGGRL